MTDDLSYDRSYEIQSGSYEAAPVQPRPETVYSVRESIFALIFSFAGYFFIKLIFASEAGIGLAVYLLCIAAVSFVFMKLSGVKQSRYSMTYFVTAVVFSLNIGVTSNGLIQFLCFVFAAAMYAMWAFAANNPPYKGADDSIVYCFANAVFSQSFGNIGKCPAAAVSLTKKSRFGAELRNALIGILIAVPVTITVSAILSSADAAFGRIMESISDVVVSNFLSGIMKYIFGLPLSFLIFGIVFSAAKSSGEKLNLCSCARQTASVKIAPAATAYASVIPLCAVYVIFFFSQLSYFTSAFRNVLPEEFSAAEYARRGFFELCAVSVINLFVIVMLNLFCRYNDDGSGGRKRPAALNFFTVLLSVFTLILIATALSKMAMYISRFGLTRLRVYTSWFMLALAALFVLIIVRQFRVFNIARLGTVIFTVMLAFLGFAQTDALIARYNISAYERGQLQSLDLSELSADAVYAAIPLTDSDDEVLKSRAVSFIRLKKNDAEYLAWYEKSVSQIVLELAE